MPESQYDFALRICGIHGHDAQWKPIFIPAWQILAALDPAVPLQKAHILTVGETLRRGGRYSGETGDVCAAAWRAIGKSEVPPFEAAWVAATLAREAA